MNRFDDEGVFSKCGSSSKSSSLESFLFFGKNVYRVCFMLNSIPLRRWGVGMKCWRRSKSHGATFELKDSNMVRNPLWTFLPVQSPSQLAASSR